MPAQLPEHTAGAEGGGCGQGLASSPSCGIGVVPEHLVWFPSSLPTPTAGLGWGDEWVVPALRWGGVKPSVRWAPGKGWESPSQGQHVLGRAWGSPILEWQAELAVGSEATGSR